jgi:retron-type reverse transcriptase
LDKKTSILRWSSGLTKTAARRPPSIPDLHRRSGSIPGGPYPPSKQIDCTAGAVSSKAKSIHSGKESGKSRGPWGDSLVSSAAEQSATEKRDDKAFTCRQGGEANLRAATEVNAVTASTTPPVSRPTQLELFPGRACVPKAKPVTIRNTARMEPNRRDGVSGGSTQRQTIQLTGETLFGPAEETPTGREAYKGRTRKRGNEAGQGVGGGRSTAELRENRGEGRAATFIRRTKQGKAAGLPPQGKAQPRRKPAERKAPVRLNNARKLQRTLYRVAKQQPERRFTLLYDKVCRRDILQEAWQRVKSNKGAAGVDQVDIDAIRDYGEERFLNEIEQELRSRQYRAALVRRVHIPKPGQPGKTRPLGIPTVKDRVVQMAVKLVIEPLFEADFLPCSFGFRPKRTPRMALSTIVQSVNDGYSFVVDVDLKSYFDTISHELLLGLVERRIGDVQVLRLIRAWLKAGVMEEGKVTHPDRGSPQGGVISPTLSNIFLHEVDRQWCRSDGVALGNVRLVREQIRRHLVAECLVRALRDCKSGSSFPAPRTDLCRWRSRRGR